MLFLSVGSTPTCVLSALSPRKMLAQFFIAAAATTPTLHCSDPAAANYQQIPDGVAAPWLCTRPRLRRCARRRLRLDPDASPPTCSGRGRPSPVIVSPLAPSPPRGTRSTPPHVVRRRAGARDASTITRRYRRRRPGAAADPPTLARRGGGLGAHRRLNRDGAAVRAPRSSPPRERRRRPAATRRLSLGVARQTSTARRPCARHALRRLCRRPPTPSAPPPPPALPDAAIVGVARAAPPSWRPSPSSPSCAAGGCAARSPSRRRRARRAPPRASRGAWDRRSSRVKKPCDHESAGRERDAAGAFTFTRAWRARRGSHVVERAAAGALLHHYADAVPIFAVRPVRVRRRRRQGGRSDRHDRGGSDRGVRCVYALVLWAIRFIR